MVVSIFTSDFSSIVEALLKRKTDKLLCVFPVSIFPCLHQCYWYICECHIPHSQNTKGQTFAINLQTFVQGKLCAEIMWV